MKNIILCGFMGSGKSSVGRLLAERLSLSFFDTDSLIEERCGMSVAEIFEKRGEEYFRALETETVMSFLNTENNIISLGGGLAANRSNHSALKTAGFVVLLDCGIEETLLRIMGDKSRPLTAGGAKAVCERYNERRPIYEAVADLTVESDGAPADTAEKIVRLLEELKIL